MVPLSVSQIEGATLTAWPALKQAHDGLWLWRYARGYTKRANSIHCLDSSDGAYAELRLQRMVELSAAHGIPPVFRVTPLTPPDIVEVLDGMQWEEFEPSLVMAMEMPDVDFPVEFNVRYFDPNDPEWYKAQAHMSGYSTETIEILSQIIGRSPARRRACWSTTRPVCRWRRCLPAWRAAWASTSTSLPTLRPAAWAIAGR